MKTTDRDNILFNMDHDSNINTVINTEGTAPEEKQEVKKTRGRPKRTGQDDTHNEPQKAREPKTKNNNIKLDDDQQQLLNIQSKLNNLKEAEQEHNEALKQFKEAEQKHDKTLKQFKEAGKEYNEALKQFKPKAKEKATPKRKAKTEGQEEEQ